MQQCMHLINLTNSKEHEQLNHLRSEFNIHCKYFFNIRFNHTIVYLNGRVYILTKKQTQIIDLGKIYPITEIAWNPQKKIIVFQVIEGAIYAHFLLTKTQIVIKKDTKKWNYFDWVYSLGTICNFFIATQSSLRFYKVQQDKKIFKEYKSISGNFNCVHYDPLSQILLLMPNGQCKQFQVFYFEIEKNKNWWKHTYLSINYDDDQFLESYVKKNKNLGFQNSVNNQQIFHKSANQDYIINLLRMNRKSYLLLHYTNAGKVKIYAINPLAEKQQKQQKQQFIKLPSDTQPSFSTIDNMLIVHLREQKITFIYDIIANCIQTLVSPFPITSKPPHQDLYSCQFRGKRAIHPQGHIYKWQIRLNAIYFYLKNDMQIFDFLYRRKNVKMQLLNWLLRQLFRLKELNLSKIWKLLFLKVQHNTINQNNEIITLQDLYSNVFATLGADDMTPKKSLMNIILECIRQAHQYKIAVPKFLQKLIFQLLMQYKKYQLLVYLSHNEVINGSQWIMNTLLKEGSERNQQILVSLGVDIANRIMNCSAMLTILMQTQRVKEAIRYIKLNYQSMQVLHLIEVSKQIIDSDARTQYIRYIKNFITRKYCAINIDYLDQIEQKVLEQIKCKENLLTSNFNNFQKQ